MATIDEVSAAQPVPCCPQWTVKDVIAHLCGLNAEFLAGVQGGLGTDEATTRQVTSRSEATLAQVLEEWQSHAEPIHATMTENEVMGSALLADLVVHVFDLVEVLSHTTDAAAAATPTSAHRYVPLLQERVAERVAVGLHVELTDGTSWPAPDGETLTPTSLRTTPHNFLRGVTGRLRRDQVEAFEWSTDPTVILDSAWNQYGDFRSS